MLIFIPFLILIIKISLKNNYNKLIEKYVIIIKANIIINAIISAFFLGIIKQIIIAKSIIESIKNFMLNIIIFFWNFRILKLTVEIKKYTIPRIIIRTLVFDEKIYIFSFFLFFI